MTGSNSSHHQQYVHSRRNLIYTLPSNISHGRPSPLRITYSDVDHRRADDPRGPVLLFIGGAGRRRYTGLRTIDVLARKHHIRCIQIDRFGLGGSENVPFDRRVQGWVDLVPAFLDHLQIKHVALASHSAGTIYLFNTILAHRHLLHPTRPFVCFFAPWIHYRHSKTLVSSLARFIPTYCLRRLLTIDLWLAEHLPRWFLVAAVRAFDRLSEADCKDAKAIASDVNANEIHNDALPPLSSADELSRSSASSDGSTRYSTATGSTRVDNDGGNGNQRLQTVVAIGEEGGGDHQSISTTLTPHSSSVPVSAPSIRTITSDAQTAVPDDSASGQHQLQQQQRQQGVALLPSPSSSDLTSPSCSDAASSLRSSTTIVSTPGAGFRSNDDPHRDRPYSYDGPEDQVGMYADVLMCLRRPRRQIRKMKNPRDEGRPAVWGAFDDYDEAIAMVCAQERERFAREREREGERGGPLSSVHHSSEATYFQGSTSDTLEKKEFPSKEGSLRSAHGALDTTYSGRSSDHLPNSEPSSRPLPSTPAQPLRIATVFACDDRMIGRKGAAWFGGLWEKHAGVIGCGAEEQQQQQQQQEGAHGTVDFSFEWEEGVGHDELLFRSRCGAMDTLFRRVAESWRDGRPEREERGDWDGSRSHSAIWDGSWAWGEKEMLS